MSKTDIASLQVVAMHGWAGDSRCWGPWIKATNRLGWRWQCGERGYGELEPREAAWAADASRDTIRLFIGHSLGPHLVAPDALQRADFVVLLASFGAFAPTGRAGRQVRTALDGMAAQLGREPEAKGMLQKFLAKAASPETADLMPTGPIDGRLLGLTRLREDLEFLAQCEGLPCGFPDDRRVLIVEGGQDKIVGPEARAMLREALPAAAVICLEGAGHALLKTSVIGTVVDWVQSRR